MRAAPSPQDRDEEEIERALDRIARGQVIVHASSSNTNTYWAVVILNFVIAVQAACIVIILSGGTLLPFRNYLGQPEVTLCARKVVYTAALAAHVLPAVAYIFQWHWLQYVYASITILLGMLTISLCLSSVLDLIVFGSMCFIYLSAKEIQKNTLPHLFQIRGSPNT